MQLDAGLPGQPLLHRGLDPVEGLLALRLRGDRQIQLRAEAFNLLNNPTPERIRLAPPLVLTDADANGFLSTAPLADEERAADVRTGVPGQATTTEGA